MQLDLWTPKTVREVEDYDFHTNQLVFFLWRSGLRVGLGEHDDGIRYLEFDSTVGNVEDVAASFKPSTTLTFLEVPAHIPESKILTTLADYSSSIKTFDHKIYLTNVPNAAQVATNLRLTLMEELGMV